MMQAQGEISACYFHGTFYLHDKKNPKQTKKIPRISSSFHFCDYSHLIALTFGGRKSASIFTDLSDWDREALLEFGLATALPR